MKRDITVILLCFAAALAGANVTPILSGSGKVIFPEASPSATLSASAGALTALAGGTNKNVVLTPSGSGVIVASGVEFGTWPVTPGFGWLQSSAFAPTASNYAMLQGNSGDTYLNSAGGQVLHLRNANNDVANVNATGIAVNATATGASYAVDATGDINASVNVREAGKIVIDQFANVLAGGGSTNVVWRCATAGALPVGALTINGASCGTTTDTQLRVK